jgi:kinesin family protein 22
MEGTPEQPGVVPRAAALIFDQVRAEQTGTWSTKVLMSQLEIYNEKICDLLDKDAHKPDSKQQLEVRQQADGSIVVPGLAEIELAGPADFTVAYRAACASRAVGSTNLNAHSSRSHCVLILKVQRVHSDSSTGRSTLRTGKLHLIDLAGSEDNRKTGNVAQRLKESSNINMSLFALGNVIDALRAQAPPPKGAASGAASSASSTGPPQQKVQARVPYRDSKVTAL